MSALAEMAVRKAMRMRGGELRAFVDAALDVAKGSRDRELQKAAEAALAALRAIKPEAVR